MSRNWTPQEMHKFDVNAYKQYGEYMHDQRIYLVEPKSKDGKETDLSCKRYPVMYEKYPNLCFLLGAEYVKNMYNDGLSVRLREVEALLVYIIDADDRGFLTVEEGNEAYFDTIVKKWYVGTLDKNFYYCEENNEMLVNYIYFEEFKSNFKVGDKAYYTLDDFDMVKPKTIECIIRGITDNYILVEADFSDHIMLDFDTIKEYKFRKAV